MLSMRLLCVGSSPALFMKVRRESVQTRSETGTWRREALRHTRAECRRAERRDCPSQPRIRAYSRSFMNNAWWKAHHLPSLQTDHVTCLKNN